LNGVLYYVFQYPFVIECLFVDIVRVGSFSLRMMISYYVTLQSLFSINLKRLSKNLVKTRLKEHYFIILVTTRSLIKFLKIIESCVFIFSKLFFWHSLGENVSMIKISGLYPLRNC